MFSPELLDALLGRDRDEIGSVVRRLIGEEGAVAALTTIAHFGVLAFNTSLHGKHALAAIDSLVTLSESAGPGLEGGVVEAAIYSANARLPWSEPPITSQPDPGAMRGSPEELSVLRREGDRTGAEQWLAAAMEREDFPAMFFSAAAAVPGDDGHDVILAVIAWRLAALFPPAARYATLRTAVWQWLAVREEGARERRGTPPDSHDLLERLIRRVSSDPAPERFHELALFDAALEAAALAGTDEVLTRVMTSLDCGGADDRPGMGRSPVGLPVYPYARDLGQLLKAHAIAARMTKRLGADLTSVIAACDRNLETSSFDDWSFG